MISYGAGLFVNVEQAPVRFSLPEPTGPLPVGTTELHLIDGERSDPWFHETQRELMISIWYPATVPAERRLAPYMTPRAAEDFTRTSVESLGIPSERIESRGVRSHAWAGAAADVSGGLRAVVLFSPGGHQPRTLGTIYVEDLASYGYVVVTIDHTHEVIVEFPGGRLETSTIESGEGVLEKMLAARVADLRFVLDQLAVIQQGGNSDADGRQLPANLAAILDLSRIGSFGHSAGGFTTLQAMAVDDRIDAGVNMDGSLAFSMSKGIFGEVANTGLDRPFMLFGAGLSGSDRLPHTHVHAQDWKTFWENSTGWKREFYIPEGEHFSFTDQQSILPQIDHKIGLPDWLQEGMIGTVDADVAVTSIRSYLLAFFNLHLREEPQPLLEGHSPAHPFVDFIE